MNRRDTFLFVLVLLTGCAAHVKRAPPPAAAPQAPTTPVARVQASGRDSDRLLIDDASDLKEKSKLTRAQVKEDIDLLVYALKFGYGGRKYVDRRSYDGALKLLESLPSALGGEVSSRALLDKADEILYAITDSHLALRSARTGLSAYRKARTRVGRVGANVGAGATAEATAGADRGKVWELKYRPVWGLDRTVTKRLPILSITSLAAPEDERWQGFKAAVDEAAKSSVIAIDLRGNGGGSDAMGAWLAARLLGREVVSPFDSIMRSSTPESLAIAANAWKLKILWNKADSKPVPDYFRARLAEKMREYEAAKSEGAPARGKNDEQRFAMEYKPEGGNFARYDGHVILIVDAECASSCESLVEFFEKAPSAITVGENTAGAVHFGNPGFVVLPNSQLIAEIATDYWRYRDGRSLERIGHRPRVLLKPGESPMASVDRLAFPNL